MALVFVGVVVDAAVSATRQEKGQMVLLQPRSGPCFGCSSSDAAGEEHDDVGAPFTASFMARSTVKHNERSSMKTLSEERCWRTMVMKKRMGFSKGVSKPKG